MSGRALPKVKVRKLGFLLLTMLAVWSLCTGTGVIAGPFSKKDGLSSQYRQVLKRWTAEDKLYHDFIPVLLVEGTFKTVAFRQAYTAEYALKYHLGEHDKYKMLVDQALAAEASLDFLLALSAPEKQLKHLALKGSIWRVFLEGCGMGNIEPFEIREINRKKETRSLGFFPYLSPWAKVYEVRFLLPCAAWQTGELSLVLTSYLGTARLIYQLED